MNYNIYYENELVSTLIRLKMSWNTVTSTDSKLYMSLKIHTRSMLTFSHVM